jgi:hypothetical protein
LFYACQPPALGIAPLVDVLSKLPELDEDDLKIASKYNSLSSSSGLETDREELDDDSLEELTDEEEEDEEDDTLLLDDRLDDELEKLKELDDEDSLAGRRMKLTRWNCCCSTMRIAMRRTARRR